MSYVKLWLLLARTWRAPESDAGQALAETSLIIAFVAVVCVLALTAVGVAVAGGIADILPGLGG
jgi:hypothetical protein